MSRTLHRRSQPAPASQVDPARAALRNALQAQREADERVKFLEENLYRANRDHSDRYYDLTAANNELNRQQRAHPIDVEMAEAYVYQNAVIPSADLQAAEQAYAAAEKGYQDIQTIQNAIAAELARNIDTASAAKVKVGQAIAEVVQPHLPRLLQQINHHWTQLRSIRAVCDQISRTCAGQLPADWLSRYQESQPLAADRVGYPVDQAFVDQWQTALAALSTNADTRLPD